MKNKEIAKGLEDKIINNEKVHKEEAAVRNGAKERAKRTAINIPKLKECKYHLNNAPAAHKEEGANSMIFLTEGDSAAGSLEKSVMWTIRRYLLCGENPKTHTAKLLR
jgi:topoisomerase-4 subunit B